MSNISTLHEDQLASQVNHLRVNGIADNQIAAALGLHPSLIQSVPYPRPNHNRSRAVQHMQLQVMAQQLVPAIEKGDRDAMLTLLKVQKREADLLGLDAPKETISRNFNTDLDIDGMTIDQLREVSTADLKAMVYRKARDMGNVTDVTPETAPETALDSQP